MRTEFGTQSLDRALNALEPLRRLIAAVALEEQGYDFVLQEVHQLRRLSSVAHVVGDVSRNSLADGPAKVGCVGFVPPAVQLADVQRSIERCFHAACSAGLHWTAWSIQPDVASLNQQLCELNIIVGEKHYAAAEACFARSLDDLLYEEFAGLIASVRLASEH